MLGATIQFDATSTTLQFMSAGRPVSAKRKLQRRGRSQRGGAPPSRGTAVVYGLHPVRQALVAGKRRLGHLWIKEARSADAPSGALAELRRLAESRQVPVGILSGSELSERCGSESHQGALLECGPLPLPPAEEALGAPAQSRLPPLLVALDEVEDPRNLGAIVRGCAAFGVQGVIVPRHRSAPLSAAASKSSAGTLEHFPIYEAANLSRFLEQAKEGGYWIAGAVIEGGQPPAEVGRDTPQVLVLGSEGRGVRTGVLRHCDHLITVPMQGEAHLNVSAACAVLLYALRGAD